jgi:hypothetical protein
VFATQTEHVLDEERDRAYLASEPNHAFMLTPIEAGETIIVCARCRGAMYPDDWEDSCPVCHHEHKLYFDAPGDLLRQEEITRDGVTITRPISAVYMSLSQAMAGGFPKPGSWYVKEYLCRHAPDLVIGALFLGLYLLMPLFR